MKARSLIRLMRPHHWLKNALVFAALLFSFSFSGWALQRAGLTFVAFCLLASAIYVINDLADVASDQQHPTKRWRPIAARLVTGTEAIWLIGGLLVVATGILYLLGPKVLLVGGLYLAINLAYSLGLKHIPILDVMLVASGFLLRVIVGALAINVTVSHWIALCSFFLALFVAFGKRRHEMNLAGGRSRRSIEEYTDGFIDQMLSLSATTAVVFYALYTIDPATSARFGPGLIYTTPLVVYGVLRYYYLIYNRGLGGDPVQLFLKDGAMIVTTVLWLGVILLL